MANVLNNIAIRLNEKHIEQESLNIISRPKKLYASCMILPLWLYKDCELVANSIFILT